ncbi:MAG: DUF1365 domain-containing protein [Verrucomicrobiae bacterium]|nr:DUF1365 domain-containing protein [Verrucomicrobiae bacterium]
MNHRSCLYDCEVVHQRLSPKRHGFRYRLFYLDLDLAEIPSLVSDLTLFSHNRFNVYAFRDADHLDVGKGPDLRANLAAWLWDQGIALPSTHRVRLITLPRILGYIFNPVCFYLIHDENDRAVHVVVEVCNTFRELKPYLIASPQASGEFRLTTPKHFYVSPFIGLTAEFDFRVRVPDDKIEIHIDDRENGETLLVSWIRGEQKALTNARLCWYSIRFPLLTLQVISKIHWQAFLLWMKRLPFIRKSDAPDQQRDLYRPHSSIQPKPTKS